MAPELTLEQLYSTLNTMNTKIDTYIASQDDDSKKKMEAKKAMEDKEVEKKKEAKSAALKAAMEEEDDDKRDAAIRAAMSDEDDKKKEGFGKPKKATTDEEKEKDAQVAAIISDKKNDMIKQILSANTIINPSGLKAVDERLKVASITEVQKEYDIIAPFIASTSGYTAPVTHTQEQPIIPFYANMAPSDVDSSQLNAASPDSDFTKFSTADLMAGKV